MNGKTAKLIRNLARTNPYAVKDMDENAPLTYGIKRGTDHTRVMKPGFRLTAKYIKRFYKKRFITTDDMRKELEGAKTLIKI
jgi:hypothetical protein